MPRNRRPLFVIAIMLCLAAMNCLRLFDKYPVRPIMVVSLIAVGMLLGALLVALAQVIKQNKEQQK